MAFASKTDYCGLVAATTPSGEGAVSPLVVKDSNLNGSEEKYQPQGQDGSFVGTEAFGSDTAPSNSYGLRSALTVAADTIKLNALTAVGGVNYALESISISTGAAQAPAISATAQEVESAATAATQSVYKLPAFSVETKQKAQILFGAFTMSGSGCNLTSCNAAISCTVNKEKVEGTKIASDCNSGVITVTGTVLSTTGTAPTISVEQGSGWVVTKAPAGSESNPEAAYKTFTFEVQKALAKTEPA